MDDVNRLLILAALFVAPAVAQTVHRSAETPKFMGRDVIVHEPKIEDGMFPKGPASICVEAPPQEQCYTMPLDFGRNTTVALVDVQKDTPALFFSAESGGVSGWSIHFALLLPQTSKQLANLFADNVTVSNQSQHTFWSEPELSQAKIFVTADYLSGPGDTHYGEHRYVISAYLWDEPFYSLVDRYVTSHWYDLEKADVLVSERPEVLVRLKRVIPGIRERSQ